VLEDALADLTNPGEMVLDSFFGSGSISFAAQNTGRVCCGVQLNPFYLEVITRRFEASTGLAAVVADTFAQVRPEGVTTNPDSVKLCCAPSRPSRTLCSARAQPTFPRVLWPVP
jgi:DNA modification methylase